MREGEVGRGGGGEGGKVGGWGGGGKAVEMGVLEGLSVG